MMSFMSPLLSGIAAVLFLFYMDNLAAMVLTLQHTPGGVRAASVVSPLQDLQQRQDLVPLRSPTRMIPPRPSPLQGPQEDINNLRSSSKKPRTPVKMYIVNESRSNLSLEWINPETGDKVPLKTTTSDPHQLLQPHSVTAYNSFTYDKFEIRIQHQDCVTDPAQGQAGTDVVEGKVQCPRAILTLEGPTRSSRSRGVNNEEAEEDIQVYRATIDPWFMILPIKNKAQIQDVLQGSTNDPTPPAPTTKKNIKDTSQNTKKDNPNKTILHIRNNSTNTYLDVYWKNYGNNNNQDQDQDTSEVHHSGGGYRYYHMSSMYSSSAEEQMVKLTTLTPPFKYKKGKFQGGRDDSNTKYNSYLEISCTRGQEFQLVQIQPCPPGKDPNCHQNKMMVKIPDERMLKGEPKIVVNDNFKISFVKDEDEDE